LPAFAQRQQRLSPDQYEIVDVRSSKGVKRAMAFPKELLKAEWAHAPDVWMKRGPRRPLRFGRPPRASSGVERR
jgi:hypothetical protein